MKIVKIFFLIVIPLVGNGQSFNDPEKFNYSISVFTEYNYFEKQGVTAGVEIDHINADIFFMRYEDEYLKGIYGAYELIDNGYVMPLLGIRAGIKGKNTLIVDPTIEFRFFDDSKFNPIIYAAPITIFSEIQLGFKLRYEFGNSRKQKYSRR